ncbi:MAG: alanine:cation symporter family protein [Planctomycetes bacterium]|nr:alanine:cation symporter family protein [Planctomycetota bacterium]
MSDFDLGAFAGNLAGWVWSVPLFFLLLGCGLLFSAVSKFVQWRILTHGYACIRGHYDRPGDTGHINHFQALCAALSATIGLGNIAGVAVAVSVGGPGAVFWMWVVGVFGMALKFMECTLAVMFRDVRDVPDPSAPALMEHDAEDRTLEYAGEQPPEPGTQPRARGEVRGGPMWYIQKGLVEPLRARGSILWVPFKVLAVLFAVATMLNSFGGGNMFQGWNVSNIVKYYFDVSIYLPAVVFSALVAMVIIGGIKRIGQVASKLVPFMCAIYVLGALYVIILHTSLIPQCLGMIMQSAFTPTAGFGGFAGATIWIAFKQGLRRACFSNEAGEGSAAMAHAAAKTEEPIREGVVAGIGPFVDTIIICTMSALVLLMTGAWSLPALGTVTAVEGERVVVSCAADLPEHFQRSFLERIRVDEYSKLAVILQHDPGAEPASAPLSVMAIDGDPSSGWQAVKAVTLNLNTDGVSDENRARVAVGQPVSLNVDGAQLTAVAFDTAVFGFGKWIVTLGVCLFAFSTMISWSYYGEKGAEYLLGPRAILPYKFMFVIFVFLGMVLRKFQTVYDISDATTGLMVLCNLPAVLVLSPAVLRAAKHYFRRLDAGEMPRYK